MIELMLSREKNKMAEQKYKLIALYGEGGCGKSSLLEEILNFKELNLHKVIGTTTRPPRDGEKDGVDYYFVSDQKFAEDLLNGDLVEAAAFRNWYYGTSIAAFDKNKINIGIFNPSALGILLKDSRFSIAPVYIDTTRKNRLLRMLSREEEPDIDEIVRRDAADLKDFNNFFEEEEEFPTYRYLNNREINLFALKNYFTFVCEDLFDNFN